MAIRFDCTQCGREFSALDASAGRETKCPDCGTSITIPPQSTLPDPAPMVIDESTAAPVTATVVDAEPVIPTPVAPSPTPTPTASAPTPAASSRSNRQRNRASSNPSGPTEPSTLPVSGKKFWLFTAAFFGGCMVIVVIAILLIEMLG